MIRFLSISVFLFALLAAAGFSYWGITLFQSREWQIGEIGDYFGGVLGGTAFLLLFYSTVLQQHQIGEQNKQTRNQQRVTTQQLVFQIFDSMKTELERLSQQMAEAAKLVKNEDTVLRYRENFSNGDRLAYLSLIWINRHRPHFQQALQYHETPFPYARETYIGLFQNLLSTAEEIEDNGHTIKNLLNTSYGRGYRALCILATKEDAPEAQKWGLSGAEGNGTEHT